jgi:hypothetical protein
MVDAKGRKSKLLPVGLCFVVVGIALSLFLYNYAWSAEFEGESTVAVLLLISAVMALLVPVGIILAVIGLVRNKRARREGSGAS